MRSDLLSTRDANGSTGRGARVALGILVAYATALGTALLLAAPIRMRVELPLYGKDTIEIGAGGALVIGGGALLAALGAWVVSIGARKNGALLILLGCAAPQIVTSSPPSLVVSVPTLVGAIVAAVWMTRNGSVTSRKASAERRLPRPAWGG